MIVSVFKNISLDAQILSLADSDLDTIPSGEDISAWLGIEGASEVQEALVEDGWQKIEGLEMERSVPPEPPLVLKLQLRMRLTKLTASQWSHFRLLPHRSKSSGSWRSYVTRQTRCKPPCFYEKHDKRCRLGELIVKAQQNSS